MLKADLHRLTPFLHLVYFVFSVFENLPCIMLTLNLFPQTFIIRTGQGDRLIDAVYSADY